MKGSIGRLAAIAASAMLSFAACGGSQQQSKSTSAKAGEGTDKSCEDYARALCTELGPQSDGCRSAIGIVALFSPRACAIAVEDFDQTRERIGALRGDCDKVAKRVCDELGKDSESCQAITEDLPNIPPGHCAALYKDQDRIIAALHERQAQNEPLSDQLWQSLLAGQPPSFGSPSATVTVVEFSDFQCPYCAEAANTVHKLREKYGERIRFVFRNFPLPFHPNARAAAQAGIAAQAQGKFWEYHDRLFANQDALDAANLIEHAKTAGLDVEAFRTASTGEASSSRVDEDLRLGEAVHVQGTPTMFINKKRIENPLDYDAVAEQVDELLKN
jgi:protein-disulfide isomerase